jgi:HAE1 family hydrophobic/amphiphilic exporter-1
MQKLAEICIRRPVFATMIIMSLVVIGTAGFFKLGVDRTPPVDIPTVYISTRLAGASPVEMETLISQPIEEEVNTVEGITELRSISGYGSSFVIVQFDLSRDVNRAVEDVRNRVSNILSQLPEDADPPQVTKFDSDRSPTMTIALSGQRPERELTEIADKSVKVLLERSVGVGEVEIQGGWERAISIWVDPERLAAYQIPISVIREAIVRQNADVPGGNVRSPLTEQSLRTIGRYTDPRQFNDLVVAQVNGAPIRISDLGYAEDGVKEKRSLARLNGVPCVTLSVKRQSDANAVAVIEGIKEKLPGIKAQLPSDIRMEIIEDQSRYIYEAIHEIETHLVLGSFLACLVVLAFMRNFRAVLIAGVAIPASVISTFGMMWAMDFTLNSVTMLALVLMVGIVIDDAIVVLENIFRFIEEKKMHPFEAARAATAEIGMAVLATTLSLVVIFVPVSFMSSISGRFLFQFGLTSAVAIMVSLLVSFTLTPMMSARLLRVKEGEGHGGTSRGGFYAFIEGAYMKVLAWAMAHRWWVTIGAVLIMLSAVPLYKLVPQEFVPASTDEGEFEISITAPEGTSLPAMEQVATKVEEILSKIPEVKIYLASIGSSRISGSNNMRVYVRIPPHAERTVNLKRFLKEPLSIFKGNYSQQDVAQKVRTALRQLPHLRVAVRAGASSISIGGPSYEIDYSLLGPDLESLAKYAEELRKKAPDIGIVDADTTLKLNKPELRVEIDRERAAALGVDTEDISSALRVMVGGDERVSRFRDPQMGEEYDVQLRLTEGRRNDPDTISRLFVPSQRAGLVRLDNLVQIVPAQTASRIDRLDRQRQVSLRASVAKGYAMADRIQALDEEVKKMNLPPVYKTQLSGRAKEFERTFNEFLWAFLLSIIFMYMILASQYESLIHPFTILLSLPLTLPFAFLTLWLTGNTLNLYSALGLLVLFGVVKKNSILQIDHMNQLRNKGMDRLHAIMEGNRDRLRPILMTTLTFVVGMIPLAMGSGPGAEERRAVAVVVIGGQTLALLLTLVVTPVAYSLLDDVRDSRLVKKFTPTNSKTANGGGGPIPAGAHSPDAH